jgi:hypothetical protein
MKKLFISAALFTLASTLSGCFSVVQLGKLNMISNRNIESKADYVLLKNYAGGDMKEVKKALKKTKATTLDQAVDETVRNVAGGEFLKNVKVYGVMKKKQMYLFVEGDVWGLSENISYRGFKIGDMVQWKDITGTHKGKITGLTDSEKCMVREEGKENSESLKYSSLTKVNE